MLTGCYACDHVTMSVTPYCQLVAVVMVMSTVGIFDSFHGYGFVVAPRGPIVCPCTLVRLSEGYLDSDFVTPLEADAWCASLLQKEGRERKEGALEMGIDFLGRLRLCCDVSELVIAGDPS